MNHRHLKLLAALVSIAASAPVPAAAPGGACHLLTDAEIAASFPGAKSGVPETARKKYGILGCEWSTPGGRVAVQFWNNTSPTTAKDEAAGMMLGAIDPFKAGADKGIRYQALPGVGESAVIAIAKRDAAAGVLNDLAVAAVVAGGRTITIFAPELASGDPARTVAVLSALVRKAAKR